VIIFSSSLSSSSIFLFFFTPPAPTEIYTLSLHDALPIYRLDVQIAPHREALAPALERKLHQVDPTAAQGRESIGSLAVTAVPARSEEHTSELQSRFDLVCRLLLEKKKKNIPEHSTRIKDQ